VKKIQFFSKFAVVSFACLFENLQVSFQILF
jgi:hypothetical protein